MPSSSTDVVSNSRISFLWLNCISLYMHMIFPLSVPLLMNIGYFHVLSIWIKLQWTWKYRYLFKIVILFSSDKFQELELLGHLVVLSLIFWEHFIIFFLVTSPIYSRTNNRRGFPVFYILANICSFLSFCNTHSNDCGVIFHCQHMFKTWGTAPVLEFMAEGQRLLGLTERSLFTLRVSRSTL